MYVGCGGGGLGVIVVVVGATLGPASACANPAGTVKIVLGCVRC